MLKIYFKIAFRNLWKNKTFSFINIAGLTVGMSSAILILLWVQNEMSHDRFHEKLDRIYSLNNRDTFNGELWAWNTTPKILAPTLKEDFPDVEEAARIRSANFLFSIGDKHLNVEGNFVDSNFLKIFTFPLIKGNASIALNSSGNIGITHRLAKKLLGNEDALGKVIRIDNTDNFTITGVLEDLPNNTRFNFEYLLPWSYLKKIGWDDQDWNTNSIQSFVLLNPGVKKSVFDEKIKNVTINHTKNSENPSTTQVFTQPLKDWWLYSKSENGQYVGSRIEKVKLFIVVAIFILLIACINFMNLSTARSEKRAKEVGIRKVVGAQKKGLIVQFIIESILISSFAFVLTLGIVEISLPSFNHLIGKNLFIDYYNLNHWLFALTFVLFTGLLAGSYPAFYLSSFNPAKVLKGTFKGSHTLVTPRKVLVVLQFTFAIALIICTLIIKRQIQFGQDRDPGYVKDELVYTSIEGDVEKHYDLIKNELLNNGAAIAVTKSMRPITQRSIDDWGWEWNGSNEEDKKIDFVIMASDADFAKTLGAKIIEGRDIDVNQYPTDSTAMLLNETAVKIMRLEHPIGTIVKAEDEQWHVVGVIKDFIYESPYKKVQQLVVLGPKSFFNTIHFKLNPSNSIMNNIELAKSVFKKYNPNYPINFNFVDEIYALKFQEEKRFGTLAALFSGLTIFISCLGLFSLAAYMAENRTKEIGIRKVLGASVMNISSLLSRDFLKLVIVSFFIASPIAWYLMDKWLKNYNYRINIEWWVFAIAGFMVGIIAVITVSFQSIKSALANPIKNLRSE